MSPLTGSLSLTPVVAALLGVGVAAGVLLVVRGWRGVDHARPSRLRTLFHRDRADVAGRPGRSGQRPLVRAALAVAGGLVVGLLTGWVVGAVLAGMACWALPRILGRDTDHARRLARIEGIATWTEMLRDVLSAASGLEQAILATAPLAPAAIRGEVGDLAAAIGNGERLVPSLRHLADQLADPTGDLVIAALVLAAEQQARQLGDLLGSLAQAAREQASMRMRVEAGRSRTRTSVRVIVGTTLFFAVALVMLNRPYLAAYDSATGQVVLLAIGALFCAGLVWLGRIARTAEPTRFLTVTTTVTDPAPGPATTAETTGVSAALSGAVENGR
jgi:Flp pilus assembly protein TadB